MILQALCAFYERAGEVEPGYALLGASGELVLDRDGNLVAVEPLEEQQGKRKVPRLMTVPQPPKRSGQRPAPAFLYEKGEFIFGASDKPEGAQYRFDASREIHEEVLADCDDDGARAVLRFYAKRKLGSVEYAGVDTSLLTHPQLFLVFRLQGDPQYLHERPAVRAAWEKYNAQKSGAQELVQCLVTGETAPLARLHGNVAGFGADKPTLVGFNQYSFCSFGKYRQQGANAPVGEKAAFEYVTALNLLCRSRKNSVSLGDTRLLFWAAQDAPQEETLLGQWLGVQPQDAGLDEAAQGKVKATLDTVMAGGDPRSVQLDPGADFYLLGVSANKTRLVVRCFYHNSFGELLDRMTRHYRDISVEGMRSPYPSPGQLLLETAMDHKYDGIPPLLQPALLDSILSGGAYPATLYQAVLRRVRAEKTVSALRAGILKGTINRLENREAITMALNEEERDRAYLLGRLFALCEYEQKRAIGQDINASIADKYLNSALSTPQMVFPTLLELCNKHLSKTGDIWMAEKISGVMDMIELGRSADGSYAFPPSFSANDQGKMLLGYYHQQQAL